MGSDQDGGCLVLLLLFQKLKKKKRKGKKGAETKSSVCLSRLSTASSLAQLHIQLMAGGSVIPQSRRLGLPCRCSHPAAGQWCRELRPTLGPPSRISAFPPISLPTSAPLLPGFPQLAPSFCSLPPLELTRGSAKHAASSPHPKSCSDSPLSILCCSQTVPAAQHVPGVAGR